MALAALADTCMLQVLMLVLCAPGVFCDQVVLSPGGSASLLGKQEPKMSEVASTVTASSLIASQILSSKTAPVFGCAQVAVIFGMTSEDPASAPIFYQASFCGSEGWAAVEPVQTPAFSPACCATGDCCQTTAKVNRRCTLKDAFHAVHLDLCDPSYESNPAALSQLDDATRANETLREKQMLEKDRQKVRAEEAAPRQKLMRRVTRHHK